MDLEDFGKSAAELKIAFETLQEQIKDNAKLLSKLTGDAAKGFEPSINKVKNLTNELAKADKQSLSNYKERLQFESKLQQAQKELTGLVRQRNILSARLSVANREEKIQLLALIDNYDDLIYNSQEVVDNTKKLKEELKPINEAVGTKLFGAFSDIANKIPGLSRFSGPFKEASEAAEKMATQNQLTFGNAKGISKAELESLKTGKGISKELKTRLGLFDKNGNLLKGASAASRAQALGITQAASKSMSPLMAGIKAIGPALSKALGPIGLLVELVMAVLDADKAAGDLAKGMNMTYEQAVNLRGEFSEMANLSGDIAVTTRELQESYMAIGQNIGAQVDMGKANLELMTKLREKAGVSNEVYGDMLNYAAATGQEVEKATTGFLGGAKAVGMQAGKILNVKQLMTETSKVSNAIKLSIKGGAQALGEAAAKAKLVGMNLEQADRAADSLLNFEESITAELEAELLTGKDLNLERARLAALNNDYATVSQEIARNVGSAAKFNDMNRLQQEAIAKSVGMQRDELANVLVEQEALRALGRKLTDEEQAAYEFAKEKYGAKKAAEMLGKKELEDMMKQQSIQERFNKSIEKLKEIFVSVAEPLLEILDPLVSIVTDILPLINFILQPTITTFKALGALISTLIKGPLGEVKNVLSGIMDIFSGDFEEGFKKIGKAIVRALISMPQAVVNFGIEMVNGYVGMINKILGLVGIDGIAKIGPVNLTRLVGMEDGMIGPDGGLVVSGKKGTYSLDANDTVIAGTNLNKPAPSTTGGTNVDISPLLEEMRAVKQEIARMASRPIMIENTIDGTNFGTATAMNTYKTQ